MTTSAAIALGAISGTLTTITLLTIHNRGRRLLQWWIRTLEQDQPMTERHTVDTITSDELDQLYDERDRLRAGEEPGYVPLTVPTPGQWIDLWNRASPTDRLRRAEAVVRDTEIANRCEFDGHVRRLADAEAAIARVRTEADTIERGVAGVHDVAYVCRAAANRIRAALDGPAPSPCPSCRRADQAGLATTELHTVCTTKEQL